MSKDFNPYVGLDDETVSWWQESLSKDLKDGNPSEEARKWGENELSQIQQVQESRESQKSA